MGETIEVTEHGRLCAASDVILASALRLGPRLTALVGYDRRLTDAATALGLPVAAPV